MHLHLHVRLLRPRDLVETPRDVLPLLQSRNRRRNPEGTLGTHHPLHLLRRPPPRLHRQRSESASLQERASAAPSQGMDTASHLRRLHHGLARIALLEAPRRQPPRPLLPDHVPSLRTHDNQDHPRASHTPALPLLDHHARTDDRRRPADQPPLLHHPWHDVRSHFR